MIPGLILPKRGIIVPKMPSYVKLAMSFGGASDTYLFDKSRYRSHGTITDASWVTGLHGKALSFDRTTPSYVLIPASYTQLDFTSGKFSIIFRLKVDDLTIPKCLFNRGTHVTDGYSFFIHSEGYLFFATYQSGSYQRSISSTNDIVTGTWYTIGVSRNGTTVNFYVNGVEPTTEHGVHTDPAACSRSVKIGIRNDLIEYPFDGKLEFLRIFGGIALSTSAHLAWHNALA